MPMTILNNNAAMLTLGQLNKNQSKLQKALQKAATCQKIVGAGDGASEYSISEKLRVRIRALDQDSENVQNGASMLRIAAGAIQSQLDALREIKRKVIDANNDSNNDVDRQTIQKEVAARFNLIADIAGTTTYNGKYLLIGEEVEDVNITDHLSGLSEPYPFFSETLVQEDSNAALGLKSVEYFDHGAGGAHNKISTSTNGFLSGIKTYHNNWAATLIVHDPSNTGRSEVYAATRSPWVNYGGGVHVIDISSCNTDEDVAAAVAAGLSSMSHIVKDATSSGTTINMTSVAGNSGANDIYFTSEQVGNLYWWPGGDPINVPIGNAKSGTDPIPAYHDIDLTKLASTSVDDFISELAGHTISYNGNKYEFIDTSAEFSTDGVKKTQNSVGVDLKSLHGVSKDDVAEKFAKLFMSYTNDSAMVLDSGNVTDKDGNVLDKYARKTGSTEFGKIKALRLYSNANGAEGNNSSEHTINYDEIFVRPYQVTKVIIQDTDTAGMAVQIAIPRTTMDHILGVLPEKHSIEEFDVTKKEMREQLLGREKTYWSTLSREERLEYLKKTRVDDSSPDVAEDGWTGMLDHGVEYLLKSLSYVGSQINRLENSENNIATEIDTTTNVESTIRDADMAQTATEYDKFSVLTQSGQAMLAQANQNQSGVLSLLS